MATRVERILNSIRLYAGAETYQTVKTTCGKDVQAILAMLEENTRVDVIVNIMHTCGQQCIPHSYIDRAKYIFTDSNTIEDFLHGLNIRRIGGGKLHLRDGKLIGIYEQCYCSLARETKGLSPLYCHCSEGWYEKLFSSVFEKPVEVKKRQTILDGSEYCEFEIDYSK